MMEWLFVLLAFIVAIAWKEFQDWLPLLGKHVLAKAVAGLPADMQERMAEEWAAVQAEIPGKWSPFINACTLWIRYSKKGHDRAAAFVSDEEVHRVVARLESKGEPDYIDGVLEGGTVDGDGDPLVEGGDAAGEKDPMYDQAVEVVLKNRKASISLVQRHLRIGYNRAARLLEDMENAGLVSALSGSGRREVLAPERNE